MQPAQIAAAVGDDPTLVAQYWPDIEAGLQRFKIDDHYTRVAAAATTAVECDFRWLTELADGSAYEGRLDLGNTQPGDGVRYKGRGFVMVTGRTGYDAAGKAIGVDLVNNPELAARPDIAGLTLGYYFFTHGIQRSANAGDWWGVRAGVNGGYNGIQRFLGYVTNLLALPDTPAPTATVTTLGVNETLYAEPRADSTDVADLAAGCTVTFIPDPPAFPTGVTPHWAYVRIDGGTTQKLRPVAGVKGWLLRANLRTDYVR